MAYSNSSVALDIPEKFIEIAGGGTDKKQLNKTMNEIIKTEVDNCYSPKGRFKGIKVKFKTNPYEGAAKKDSVRLMVYVGKDTYEKLRYISRHTLISVKNVSEILVLKNLMKGGDEANAEDSDLYNEQTAAADSGSCGKASGNADCGQ